jgi:crotonyl-CoA reductase
MHCSGWAVSGKETGGVDSPRDGVELIDHILPPIAPDEVLVKVQAAAINYNNVWSALHKPISSLNFVEQYARSSPREARHDTGYQIIGSDAAGEIEAVGDDVMGWESGDKVCVHCHIVSPSDPVAQQDAMLSDTQKIWGYETNFGAFSEYAIVKATQLLPKPAHLSWAEAACLSLTNATAYRMLISGNAAKVKPGDVVLIWGAAGGLGLYANQLCKLVSAQTISVVSGDRKAHMIERLGYGPVIDRQASIPFVEADGRPVLPNWAKFARQVRRCYDRSPDVVFEHVGRETLGLSIYLTRRGGQIVTCAATSGYEAMIDLRYLWMELKTLIGSHFANYNEAWNAHQLVIDGFVQPTLSRAAGFEALPALLDDVWRDRAIGKLGLLVNATDWEAGIEDVKSRAQFGTESYLDRLRLAQ